MSTGRARDDETIHEPRAQEPLDRDAAVDVETTGAAGSQPRNDFRQVRQVLADLDQRLPARRRDVDAGRAC